MAKSKNRLVDQVRVFEDLQKNPTAIFSQTSHVFNRIAKQLLDPLAKQYSVLDEIYIKDLDSTQVFGQTKMVLEGAGEKLLFEKIPEIKEKYQQDEEENQDEEDGHDEEEDDPALESGENAELPDDLGDAFSDTANEEEEEEEESDNDSVTTKVEPTVKKDAFGLNDGFFDIDEFNKQIVAMEDEELGDDDIDYFANVSDSDEDEMPYYEDFYNKPNGEAEADDKEADADDKLEDDIDEEAYDEAVGTAMTDLLEEQPPETLSSFEKQQKALQAEIAELEAELVAEKKWTMKGEVSAKTRPVDSLLDDEDTNMLEFDRTAKPVPVITDEVTESIDELIRRRIKAEEFDDLPRRIITDVSKFHNKQKFELSEEKSSKSLAELYEDDYKKVDMQAEVSEEVQKQHDEIAELFATVNHHLDSLSSAHFVPKPHQFTNTEIKVSDTAATITMEDAQPTHVSDEAVLAPQEIYKIGDDKPTAHGAAGRSEVVLKSGLAVSKDELSREDKQRMRRATKRKKAKHFEEREELKKQRDKQAPTDNKRQKVSDVVDTLAKAKNVTVIDKKGKHTDVQGHVKRAQGAQSGSSFRL